VCVVLFEFGGPGADLHLRHSGSDMAPRWSVGVIGPSPLMHAARAYCVSSQLGCRVSDAVGESSGSRVLSMASCIGTLGLSEGGSGILMGRVPLL
jgi:hypothetical protein